MNKVAIVTGGASGIGLSIAEKLLKNNYQVIISYNSSTDSARSLLEKYENLFFKLICLILKTLNL